MLAWKIAPALAAGNTVVLKPAEFTPLTALAFAEICIEAGLPPGVVNIVTGDGATGAALVAHDDVDKIAFTGSTEVGRAIRKATRGNGQETVAGARRQVAVHRLRGRRSRQRGRGRRRRDLVQPGAGVLRRLAAAGRRRRSPKSFIAKLRARMAQLRVGDPLDKSTDVGAIVAPVQLERIKRLVGAGRARGGESLARARRAARARLLLSADAGHRRRARLDRWRARKSSARCWSTMTFRTPDEAIALANNTRYGLAASVWTENVNRALEVAARIKAGVVWINSTNLFDAAAGFGGYRESGFGREGGREGLAEYLVADAPKGKANARRRRRR